MAADITLHEQHIASQPKEYTTSANFEEILPLPSLLVM